METRAWVGTEGGSGAAVGQRRPAVRTRHSRGRAAITPRSEPSRTAPWGSHATTVVRASRLLGTLTALC